MRGRFTVSLIALAIFLLPHVALATDQRAQGQSTDCGRGIEVKIEGTLLTHREFGPPGWGDDLAHDQSWTMTTVVPADRYRSLISDYFTRCGEDVTRAKELQIRLEKSSNELIREGGQVVIQGRLRFAYGAPTEVLLGQIDVANMDIH